MARRDEDPIIYEDEHRPSTAPAAGGCPFKHAAATLPDPELGMLLSQLIGVANKSAGVPLLQDATGGDHTQCPSFVRVDERVPNPPDHGLAKVLDEIHHAYRGMAKRCLSLIDKDLLPKDVAALTDDFRRAVSLNHRGWKHDDTRLRNQAEVLSEKVTNPLRQLSRKKGKLPIVLKDMENKPFTIEIENHLFVTLFTLGWAGVSQLDIKRVTGTISGFIVDRVGTTTKLTGSAIPFLHDELAAHLETQRSCSKAEAKRLLAHNGLAIDHGALRQAIDREMRDLQNMHHYMVLKKASRPSKKEREKTPFENLLQHFHLTQPPYRVETVSEAMLLLSAMLSQKHTDQITEADSLTQLQSVIEREDRFSARLEDRMKNCLKNGAHESLLALKPALPEKLQAMIPEPKASMKNSGKFASEETAKRVQKINDARHEGRS